VKLITIKPVSTSCKNIFNYNTKSSALIFNFVKYFMKAVRMGLWWGKIEQRQVKSLADEVLRGRRQAA
jgi:hypothetical protein